MPVIAYRRIDDVIDAVNQRAKPLALYVFSNHERFSAQVLESTSSGGATVNDVFRHVTEPALPFGGAGPSGHGAYHGRYTFTAFSHPRSVYFQASGDNPAEKLTRAPFKGKLEALLGQSTASS
jgi:aldehyde dehydrogenase (NAD+)